MSMSASGAAHVALGMTNEADDIYGLALWPDDAPHGAYRQCMNGCAMFGGLDDEMPFCLRPTAG